MELLVDNRYLIWLIGGTVTCLLLIKMFSWADVARHGTWSAERDYATWRLRNALLLLILLVPLLIATTAASVL